MSRLVLLAFALLLAAPLAYQCTRSPRFALGFWWAVMCLVPYWLEPRVVFLWPPQAFASLIVLPAIVKFHRDDGLRIGDLAFTAIIVMVLLAFLFGSAGRGVTEQLVVQGGFGYIVGRKLVAAAGFEWFAKVICWSGLFLAAWGILERFAGVHLFEHLAYGPEGSWALVKMRGGHTRSDAAFGDPIILGAFLAYTIPFIAVSRWRDVAKAVSLVIVGLGIFATDTRGAFLAAILGLILVITLDRSLTPNRRFRLAVVTLCIAIPAAIGVAATFTESNTKGQTQLAQSTSYRESLYSTFLGDIRPLEQGNGVTVNSVTGVTSYRSFVSIDSTFILVALDFGWLPSLVAVIGIVWLALRALTRRASLFQLALLGQVPMIATVALITQYRTFVFFAAGLATACSIPKPARARAARWLDSVGEQTGHLIGGQMVAARRQLLGRR